jgi:hypothetical protein
MCVICICDKEKPTLELIKKMADANKDGIGIAYIKDGNVHWKKGITEEQAFLISESVNTPLIMHFRISTVGGNSKHLTHPFPLNSSASLALEGKTNQGVLFHNGHWHDWRDKLWGIVTKGLRMPKGHWSDSRAIAWLVGLYGRQILSLIDNQKVALLTPKSAEMYGSGWEEKNGMHFSNLSFETTCMTRTTYYDDDNWHTKWKSGDIWDVETRKWVTPAENVALEKARAELEKVVENIEAKKRRKDDRKLEIVTADERDKIEKELSTEESIKQYEEEQLKQIEDELELGFAGTQKLKEIKNA